MEEKRRSVFDSEAKAVREQIVFADKVWGKECQTESGQAVERGRRGARRRANNLVKFF